jgi:CRP/FNR family cyclic AMP-dependent transcriptional regulator
MSTVTMLQDVPLFAGLSDAERSALAERLARRTFAKGMIIFHKGSLGQNLYIIESGRVRIFLLSEAGQEISLNIYGPGQVFGELTLLDGLPRSAGAVAMETTVTLTLHHDDFVRYVDAYPSLAKSILAELSTRLRYITAYAESLAFLDVYGRVAAKLLELAERYGLPGPEGVEIDLRLTQGDLASWVAATREFVNKVLGAFRDQGLIKLDGQRIILLNQRALKRYVAY